MIEEKISPVTYFLQSLGTIVCGIVFAAIPGLPLLIYVSFGLTLILLGVFDWTSDGKSLVQIGFMFIGIGVVLGGGQILAWVEFFNG